MPVITSPCVLQSKLFPARILHPGEVIKLWHRRKISNVGEHIILAAKVGIEDITERIHRGNLRIKLIVMIRQIIGVQNEKMLRVRLQPGTMVALQDNNGWRFRFSEDRVDHIQQLMIEKCHLVGISALELITWILFFVIPELRRVGVFTLRSKYKRWMRHDHMSVNKLRSRHLDNTFHAMEDGHIPVTEVLTANLIEIQPTEIFDCTSQRSLHE